MSMALLLPISMAQYSSAQRRVAGLHIFVSGRERLCRKSAWSVPAHGILHVDLTHILLTMAQWAPLGDFCPRRLFPTWAPNGTHKVGLALPPPASTPTCPLLKTEDIDVM